jgi:hypothetical protein
MRCYHRRTKIKIDLDKIPIGSAKFFAECEKINAASEALKQVVLKPGTLGGLWATYFAEDHYLELSTASTRRMQL